MSFDGLGSRLVSRRRDGPRPTAVGASAFGFDVYEAAPGERLPWGYHRHPEHEEPFYVVAGELAVETPD